MAVVVVQVCLLERMCSFKKLLFEIYIWFVFFNTNINVVMLWVCLYAKIY